MNKVLALIGTILAGLAGIYLGAFLNLEGYLGIIAAVAVMGYFILQAIESNGIKRPLLDAAV